MRWDMSDREREDALLDAVFETARRQEVVPSDDLMARVLADAERERPGPVAVARPGPWTRFLDGLGGWPALGGLAAAGVAGLWIGLAPPASVEDWAAEAFGAAETVSLTGTEWSFGLEAQDG